MLGRLIENLERLGQLSPAERLAVEGLIGPARMARVESELVLDGDAATDCHLLLDGHAFRHKTLPDGRRQIVGFAAPGDFLDLPRMFLTLDYGASALTLCRVAAIPRAKLEQMLAAHPRLMRAFWRLSLVETAVQREWLVGLGRRTAYARVAHLLCELFLQISKPGPIEGGRCPFPLTQQQVADATGLSVVHVNRVLQSLRAERLIALRARQLMVLDWTGLVAAGEFDPAYLHLRRELA